jgi:raffinose/stachyose/melibiose transport system substrate-binding protein
MPEKEPSCQCVEAASMPISNSNEVMLSATVIEGFAAEESEQISE